MVSVRCLERALGAVCAGDVYCQDENAVCTSTQDGKSSVCACRHTHYNDGKTCTKSLYTASLILSFLNLCILYS